MSSQRKCTTVTYWGWVWGLFSLWGITGFISIRCCLISTALLVPLTHLLPRDHLAGHPLVQDYIIPILRLSFSQAYTRDEELHYLMGWMHCGVSKLELGFLLTQILSRVSQSFDINESKYVPLTSASRLAIKWEWDYLIFHRQITTGTGNYKGIMEIFVTGIPHLPPRPKPPSACDSCGQMCNYRNVGISKHSLHTPRDVHTLCIHV